jgi:hypothetical protein
MIVGKLYKGCMEYAYFGIAAFTNKSLKILKPPQKY